MIKLFRVDQRLLHGQVAFSWTNAIGADCILVANDEAATNALKMTTIKLAKPQGVKLVVKTVDDSIAALKSGATDKYKLLVVVESVADAKRLIDQVEGVTSLNLGGIKAKEGTKRVSKAINLLPEEETLLHQIIEKNIEVEIRQVPTDTQIIFK
ncbi:PTS sugar transporter subunit IIB [Lacrimispora sp.]|uniref:PTS sugar transporter subunit IIB n=1 Tax=Lacrimispora sp. TaxID=2719234 RepID=UPI00289A586B|nr:PTS sugar transporter subunit IIB [Lacrimispora sp.]